MARKIWTRPGNRHDRIVSFFDVVDITSALDVLEDLF